MGTTVFATTTAPGPPGPTGPPGYSPVYIVASGPPSNAIGNNGDMYIDSTNGNVYGPKVSGAWGGIQCNIKGSTGATGAQGPPGYSPVYIVAAGPPGTGVGNDHDMYINSTTSDVYGPKTSGAWGGIQCNIKGATGSQGPPGVAYTPMGPWVSTTTYQQGHEVTQNNQLYISLQANNTGHDPASSPTWWQQVGSGATQTPWLSDIDGANHRLISASGIQISSSAVNGFEQICTAPSGYAQLTLTNDIGRNAGFYLGGSTYTGDTVGQNNGVFFASGPGSSLVFGTGPSSPQERMRIASGGNVGIGTTSPTNPLVVKGVSAVTADASGNGPILRLSTGTGSGLENSLMFGVHDGDYSWIKAAQPGTAFRNLALQVDGGNVGIGNDGTGLAFSGYPQVIVGPTTNNGKSGLFMCCGNATASGTPVGSFSGVNFAIGATEKRIGEVRFDVGTTPDTGYVVFNNWVAGTAYERMRIAPNGNVGIGTSNPGYALDVTSAAAVQIRLTNKDTASNNCQLRFAGGNAATDLWALGPGIFGGTTKDFYLYDMGAGVAPITLQYGTNHVGIGNQFNPGYPLDVAGDINTQNGYFRCGGSPIPRIKAYFDQSGVRALNTVYQNTNGVPMFVSATVGISAGQYTQLLTDSNNPPGRIAFAQSNAAGVPVNETVNGWVMPNEYYRVITPSGTLVTWYEWI